MDKRQHAEGIATLCFLLVLLPIQGGRGRETIERLCRFLLTELTQEEIEGVVQVIKSMMVVFKETGLIVRSLEEAIRTVERLRPTHN